MQAISAKKRKKARYEKFPWSNAYMGDSLMKRNTFNLLRAGISECIQMGGGKKNLISGCQQ